MDYILYSDGGGNGKTDISAACIVHNIKTQQQFNIVAYLGKGTNNEAEITAGLLGLSAINALISRDTEQALSSAPILIKWVADSEYVLKGASEYIHKWVKNNWRKSDDKIVKNLGLWKTYLHLKGGLQGGIGIITEHVRGHAGHEMNELCDTAATWTRCTAPKCLENNHPHTPLLVYIPFKKDDTITNTTWVLIDGRHWLDSLRTDEPKKIDIEFYKNALV